MIGSRRYVGADSWCASRKYICTNSWLAALTAQQQTLLVSNPGSFKLTSPAVTSTPATDRITIDTRLTAVLRGVGVLLAAR